MSKFSARHLELAFQGDAAALEELCRSLRADVLSYIRTRIRPETRRWIEPDDIVQKVLVELRENLDSFELPVDEGAVRGWLCRRADWRMANALRNQRVLGETAMPEAGAVRERSDRTDGTVTREDTERFVRDLVRVLPPEYADVVRLVVLEGHSFVSAGAELGVKDDTVRKRYYRAREILAQKLKKLRND